jgi:DNA polymerase/3'-5' exonuclease PolX
MPRALHRKVQGAVSNAEVARALREMALFLELDEVPFKPRAYEKAALAVDALDRPLHEIDAERGLKGLEALPGVGEGIAKKIHARLGTGRIPDLEHLRKETIGDLDFLVSAHDASRVGRAFAAMPEVVHVYGRGETKTLVRLGNGMDADLRVVPEASFGAALCYFTASKAHNVALRRVAQARELKLNEYGLFRGRRRLAGRTEEEIYEALGLDWIPPELREDAGGIEVAGKGRLPALIASGDLRGELQIQTDWTDGSASIEEMANAARKLGLTSGGRR